MIFVHQIQGGIRYITQIADRISTDKQIILILENSLVLKYQFPGKSEFQNYDLHQIKATL